MDECKKDTCRFNFEGECQLVLATEDDGVQCRWEKKADVEIERAFEQWTETH